jgi:hypothetical protein
VQGVLALAVLPVVEGVAMLVAVAVLAAVLAAVVLAAAAMRAGCGVCMGARLQR